MSIVKRISLPLFFSFLFINATAQHSLPDTIQAVVITEKINFDGKLTEPIWTNTSALNNFTQRELDFVKPATEQPMLLLYMITLPCTSGLVLPGER